MRQLLSRLMRTEPQSYEWVQENGVYRLAIFKDDKRIAQHRLTVEYHPDNKGTIRPITEEQRKSMWFPNCKGPLEETLSDGWFMIERGEWLDGYLPAFQAYFLDGEFRYGSEHHPGFGDIRSIAEDFHKVDDFKARMRKYFDLKNYEQFMAYFTKSNLPETHRHAIKALLE